MTAYLRVVNGNDRKLVFPLNRSLENVIGRGRECHIQIEDPRASRFHARLIFEEGSWLIIDSGSRNGTLVNGSKTDSAVLSDGSTICIGDTELFFSLSDAQESVTWEQINAEEVMVPPSTGNFWGPEFKESGIRESGIRAFESLRSNGLEQELSGLHQFSLRSNSIEREQELVELTLGLLAARTGADAVAFLLSNEFGVLDIVGQVPSDPGYKPQISKQLNDTLLRKRRAVWLKHDTEPSDISRMDLGKKVGVADAICVPLLDKEEPLGAILVYSKKQGFQRRDFDFTIAVASIVAVTLVRVLSSKTIQVELGRLQAKNADFDELFGNSQVMVELKDRICRIARASGCILVRGESGAGKELVARAIHRNSHRALRPMLSVNCAAIPDELIESHLFGHVKGAFTGADRDHTGFFQQANKGTLFLDEVGELNLEGQAKLLRVLEGHPFLPVGATQEIRVDVRVISATNRDLAEFVAERRFREDLYYRLSVFELHIPPLRERGADIDLLVDLFLEHFKKQNARKTLSLSPQAREVLRNYSWPGNVRQLRNVIDSAVVLADGVQILPRDLSLRDVSRGGQVPPKLLRLDQPANGPSNTLAPRLGTKHSDLESSPVAIDQGNAAEKQAEPQPVDAPSTLKESLSVDFDTLSVEVWEQRLIQEAMRRTQGNVPAAAELMGISRATMYRKLEKGPVPPDAMPSDPVS